MVTSYWSSHQLLHQIGTTVALVGMIAVGAIATIRKGGFEEYRRTLLGQDVVVLVIWAILLVIWILDPQP